MMMRFHSRNNDSLARIVFFVAFYIVTAFLPLISHSFGTLNDLRYKIKGADGNLWEPLMGGYAQVSGREQKGTLAITFDDGPDHRTTPIILDILDKNNIKAVFFVNAAKIHPKTAGGTENQAVLRDIYRRGHFIGSHTFSHKDITQLDDSGWQNEIVQAEQIIASIAGRKPVLFRPPFGSINDVSVRRLAAGGYTTVMWNLDSEDWRAGTSLEVFSNTKKVIEENPDGGVLLFHDTNRSTVEALSLVFEWLEERNNSLVAQKKQPLKLVGIEHYIRKAFPLKKK